jgi:membrane-associated phospholipid phosphatase
MVNKTGEHDILCNSRLMRDRSMLVKKTLIALAVVLIYACAPVAAATTFAKGVGDATGPLVAVGIAATYLGSGQHSWAKAARVTDAALIAVGTAAVLKPSLSVEESGSGHTHSFPSGHTAIAFAAATSMADVFPKHKWLLYAGAAVVGWSRVESDAHTWRDVLGGAALGFGAGRWSMSAPDGLLLGRVYRF